MIRAVPLIVAFLGWLWGVLVLVRQVQRREKSRPGVEIEITEVRK